MDFHWLRKATIIPLRVIYRAIWLICILRKGYTVKLKENMMMRRLSMLDPEIYAVKRWR